jgi:hypothetical protein
MKISVQEARAMRARGFSYRQIAERAGVTYVRVWQALNPERVLKWENPWHEQNAERIRQQSIERSRRWRERKASSRNQAGAQ